MTAGLRERKKLATRRALHEAALQLVAERGLDRVSVDDIVDRAGVSQRTFFNYYASKDDAIIGWDPDYAHRLADAFTARPANESPLQALRAVLSEDAVQMASEPLLWSLRLRVTGNHPALLSKLGAGFATSERTLAAAIAARTGTRVDVDAYPTLLSGVQAAVMRISLQRWAAADFETVLPDLVAEAWDMVVAGLPEPRR